jgi:hypothetical protein
MKNNDAALIFFEQFESEKIVPVCRALPDPDHRIKFFFFFIDLQPCYIQINNGLTTTTQ